MALDIAARKSGGNDEGLTLAARKVGALKIKNKNTMKKILNIGTIPTGRTRGNVYCKVEIDEGGKLSISGVIAPLPSGNARGGCGQIDMEFKHRNSADDDKRYAGSLIKPEDFRFAEGWNEDLWFDFLEVWKRWHLNNMRAGCEHQRALGWEADGYDKHPSEPCPTCGYKFGSAWKAEALPEGVQWFLSALPESKKTPAWV